MGNDGYDECEQSHRKYVVRDAAAHISESEALVCILAISGEAGALLE